MVSAVFESPFISKKARYKKFNVGDYTYGNPKVIEYGGRQFSIGKYSSIAAGVTILLAGEHHSDWISTYPFDAYFPDFRSAIPSERSKGGVEIGNDVWIGYNALILSGVSIGSGAIVGAGSVVTKDVLPYAIVAGNPARIIRFRFEDVAIRELLRIEWWNWPHEKVLKHRELLMSSNLSELLSHRQ
jgi:acetyltransferase-like isoleucine patch superfamily enzyme